MSRTPTTTPTSRGREELELADDCERSARAGTCVGATVGWYWTVTSVDEDAEALVTVANIVAFACRALEIVTNDLVKFFDSTAATIFCCKSSNTWLRLLGPDET